MTPQQEFLVEGIVSDMAKWLMEERKLSLQAALGLIYNLQTFEKEIIYSLRKMSVQAFTASCFKSHLKFKNF